MHEVGSTFSNVLRLEVKGNSCRLKVNLNVQKPFKRGVFVQVDADEKLWLSFKYESLPVFYFGCGRMGHNLKDCTEVPIDMKNLPEDDLFVFVALKVENNLVGKVNLKLVLNLKNKCRSVLM